MNKSSVLKLVVLRCFERCHRDCVGLALQCSVTLSLSASMFQVRVIRREIITRCTCHLLILTTRLNPIKMHSNTHDPVTLSSQHSILSPRQSQARAWIIYSSSPERLAKGAPPHTHRTHPISNPSVWAWSHYLDTEVSRSNAVSHFSSTWCEVL